MGTLSSSHLEDSNAWKGPWHVADHSVSCCWSLQMRKLGLREVSGQGPIVTVRCGVGRRTHVRLTVKPWPPWRTHWVWGCLGSESCQLTEMDCLGVGGAWSRWSRGILGRCSLQEGRLIRRPGRLALGVSILPAPVGLPGDSGRRARLRGAQVRVAGPPPRGCVGRGRWAGSGPRVPSPPLPRPPPHLCVSEPGRGSQTRNKSGFPPRGCHLLGFHTSGNGGREPLPFSQCLRPPPARGLGVSLPPSVAGPRGGAGASAAGRGPSGQGRGGSQGEFDGLLCGREVSP